MLFRIFIMHVIIQSCALYAVSAQGRMRMRVVGSVSYVMLSEDFDLSVSENDVLEVDEATGNQMIYFENKKITFKITAGQNQILSVELPDVDQFFLFLESDLNSPYPAVLPCIIESDPVQSVGADGSIMIEVKIKGILVQKNQPKGKYVGTLPIAIVH